MPKSSERTRHREEFATFLTNALKLLAKQQKDGDSQVWMVVPGLLEKSRLRIMDWVRKFIAVDIHAAVQIGDPKFTTDFPGALTLRAHEEGTVRSLIHRQCVRHKMEATARG